MILHVCFNASGLILSWLNLTAPGLALVPLLLETVGAGALFALVLWLLLRRGEPVEQVGEGDKNPMEPEELFVFLTAMATVLIRFGRDLLTVCGIL